MRNDIHVKATWVINSEGINSIYFDYLNKEGNYVGNIIVDEDGTLEWHIIDMTYEDIIFDIVKIINGKETIKKLEYVEKDLDKLRWNRTKTYIQKNSLVLNRYNDNYYSNEEKEFIK